MTSFWLFFPSLLLISCRVFESIVHDWNELQRMLLGQAATPTAVIFDGRTRQSTPESGHRAGYDGAKKRKGSKAHIAVNTLGHLLSVVITPANEQERAQVGELCQQVQEITGQTIEVGFGDQGYTGKAPEYEAAVHDIDLQVITKPEGQTGFVLLPAARGANAALPGAVASGGWPTITNA